jgi:hypothetical protein
MTTSFQLMAEGSVPVIHPNLFFVMERFPDQKDAMRQLYRTSELFQSICQNYQKCAEALQYWTASEDENASERQKEYAELMQELELEIMYSLEDSA